MLKHNFDTRRNESLTQVPQKTYIINYSLSFISLLKHFMGSIMGLSAVKDFANSTTAKVALAGAIAFSAFGANAQTHDLATPGCHDQTVVLKALAENGQLQVFTGNRVTDNDPFNIITLNEKGYGYNFEQKKIAGKPNQMCLGFAFKTAILETGTTKPSWANIIQPSAGGIDVNKVYQNNGKLWFVAQSYTKNAQGVEIGGKSVVLAAGEASEKSASVWEVTPKGIPSSSFLMRNFKPQDQNVKFLVERGLGPVASAGQDQMVALQTRQP